MKVFYDNGINIQTEEFKLILDPEKTVREKKNVVGISHAHSDHAKSHHSETFLTRQTSELFSFQNAKPLNYCEKINLDGTSISLHDANHILGSSQFRIENSEVVIYTGDLRLQESLFGECEVPECDTLIIESTYGLPIFRFPEISEIREEMEKWIKDEIKKNKNILFGAYSLGKSQEVIKILNELGFTPLVHEKINRINRIYEKNKIKLDYLNAGSEAEQILKDQFIAVLPNKLMKPDFFSAISRQTKRKTATALATGWGLVYRFNVDRVFPLSDHCDFFQLIEYVEKSRAEKVLTVHGYAAKFAEQVQKRLKIKAFPLKGKQTNLFEF